jgi:hypothetical protein
MQKQNYGQLTKSRGFLKTTYLAKTRLLDFPSPKNRMFLKCYVT